MNTTLQKLAIPIGCLCCFIFIGLHLLPTQKTYSPIRPAVENQQGRYYSFSPDYTRDEIALVTGILESSQITDWHLFDGLVYKKLLDKPYGALSTWAKETYVNPKVYASQNKEHIRHIIGHELGHIFDFCCMTDVNRASFAQLTGIPNSLSVAASWLDGYEGGSMHDVDYANWKQTPAEIFAESFYSTYFSASSSAQAAQQTQLNRFFGEIFNTVLSVKSQADQQNLSPNALLMLTEIATTSGIRHSPVAVPQSYGLFTYQYPKKGENEEYVFASYKKTDSSKQIQYNISPRGYDKYESYFHKAADEIMYYNKKNYYILFKQGKQQDFTLIADGDKIVMSNDTDFELGDLVAMMETGK